MKQLSEWEEAFHGQFNPYFAVAIDGHPSAMLRLTKYMAAEEMMRIPILVLTSSKAK